MTAGLITRAWLEALATPSTTPVAFARAYAEAVACTFPAHCALGRTYLEVLCSTIYFEATPVPTPSTSLSPFGIPRTKPPTILAKPAGGLPPFGFAIPDFDIWRPGYSGAKVQIMMAGTSQPAPVFYDVLLTQPALNPQILQSQVDANGVTYGSWLRPIYTYVPYYLLINETDTTGIVNPPLTTIDGVDASYAMASAPRGAQPVQLRAWLDRAVHVANFGVWSATAGAATNGATLAAAIGAAAAQGGGEVTIPAGTFPVLAFTLPQGVILRGQGLSATSLQCQVGASVCTFGGDGAGLRNLVLDGVVLAQGSIGVDMTGVANVVFEHVLVQRFASGVRAKGVQDCIWTDFSISNCNNAADFRGDSDASLTTAGTACQNIQWLGGSISLCVTTGVTFEVFDLYCENLLMQGVQFQSNQCAALILTGARDVLLKNCAWDSCLINWRIQDGTNTAYFGINTIRNVVIEGGQVFGDQVNGAQCIFGGTCQNVRVKDSSIRGCSINLLAPQNQVTFQDCYLDPLTTVTGTLAVFATLRTNDTAIVDGVTVDASATTAWQLQLQPGQNALVHVQAVAKSENNTDYAIFWEMAGAAQASAALPYSSGTSAFSVPAVLTGQSSGAVALIQAKSGTTAAGTLGLIDITGTFQAGELITDSLGGSALCAAPITPSATQLDSVAQTSVRTPVVTGSAGYALAIVASGPMLLVQVQGASGATVAWQLKVHVVVN